MGKSRELTAKRLRELLTYDPATGVFTYRIRTAQRVQIGGVAGWLDAKTGYWRIRVDGATYLAHRLAWLYVHGCWPADLLDHADRDKSNNRIANLRECCHAENLQNVDGHKSKGASAYRGVYYHKKNGNWTAAITIRQKQRHLGVFRCETAAYAAYCRAKSETHSFAMGGENR